MKIKIVLSSFLVVALLSITSCTAADPYPDDAYFGDIYSNDDRVVTADANLVTDMVVVGDGGINGVKDTIVSIDGFGNVDTNGGTLTVDDIYAENDVNITNDLDVTDDAQIGGKVSLLGLSVYANNAAAIAGGLAVGDLYRTGGDPDLVCIVH